MTYASVVRAARCSGRLPLGWKNSPFPDQNTDTAEFNYVVGWVVKEIWAQHLDSQDMTQQEMNTLTAQAKKAWDGLQRWAEG